MAPVRCFLFCLQLPLLLLRSRAVSGPHVLGTPGQGLPIMRRDPTIAVVPQWAFVMGLGLQHGAGWTAGSSAATGPAVSRGPSRWARPEVLGVGGGGRLA